MKKSVKIVILVTVTLVLSCILVLAAILSPWVNLFFGVLLSPPPGRPEITYGEFPCRLTYEINGNIRTIEDVIICEFGGYKSRGTAGKRRVWKSELKSGNEEITLLDLRPYNQVNEFNQVMLELFFYWGNAEYYMGDTEFGRERSAQSFDIIDYKYQTSEGKVGKSGYEATEAWEKYNIRLLEWECASPIENRFR